MFLFKVIEKKEFSMFPTMQSNNPLRFESGKSFNIIK